MRNLAPVMTLAYCKAMNGHTVNKINNEGHRRSSNDKDNNDYNNSNNEKIMIILAMIIMTLITVSEL